MSTTFNDFNLAPSLQQALADLEFTTPTPVQAEAIPAAMAGKDLLVSSQTGSGKTFAFLLPTLNVLASQEAQPLNARLKNIPAPQILVLCPTRELAQQVCQDAIKLVRHIKGMRIASIMGGMPFGKQIAQLKGAQVVVATPGRLLDLINRRQLVLTDVNALIVDEADRMLDLGFSEDLEAISDLAQGRKQTLMFSATFADRIISLAKHMMNDDPVRIAIETGHSTNADVTQTLHWTDGFEHKKKLLNHWLNDENLDQAVVFASTQEDTDMLAEELAMAGHQVVALHGAMPQAVRMRRIRSLREGKVRILVATDVAARGLDVPAISHVINFGLPMKNEDYVHRIGRTGRAGRSGQAITLATHRERSKIRALEMYLQARINVSEIAGLEPSPPPAGGNDRRGRGGFGGGRDGAGRGRDGGRGFGGRDGGRGFGGRDGKRDGAPRDFAPRDHAPREHAPRDSAPRDFAPRDHAPREHAPREGGRFERDGQRFDSRPPRANDDNRGNRFDASGERAPREFGQRQGGFGAGRDSKRDQNAPRGFQSPRAGGTERSFRSEVGGGRDNREGRVVGERNFNREFRDATGSSNNRPRREFGGNERSGERRDDFRKKRDYE